MKRELRFTPEAQQNLKDLEAEPAKGAILKQVRKTLGLMETNLHHPSLNTYKYDSISTVRIGP